MNLQKISLSSCVSSTTNIKGRSSGQEFEELILSIKEKGVLTPILVRPMKDDSCFEIIAGHRRFYAARELKLEEIPAMIVPMTDAEAKEAQIVENLQRKDIHPLDEGKLYRELIEKSKYDTSSIGAKVGKPESYVKQRLFLTNLITPAADAYRAGKIIDGHAVLIAKLSSGDQTKALKASMDRYNTMSVKELKQWIEENIYSPLENQPWLKDEKAMKAVGPCVECEPEKLSLFGPVKTGTCTAIKCWARKMEKYIAWRVKEGKLARVNGEYGQAPKGVYSRSEYVQVAKSGKDRCESVHRAIIINGADVGKELDICTNLKCQTHRGMQSQYGLTPKEQEERRKERKKEAEKAKKAKIEREARIKKALDKVSWPINIKQLDALLALAGEVAGFNAYRTIAKRHELEVAKEKNSWGSTSWDYNGAMKKMIESLDDKGKMRLVFEFLADTGYDSFRSGINKL